MATVKDVGKGSLVRVGLGYLLIMTLLGGIYSFFGPLIGAAVLFMLERLTNEYTEYWPTVLGSILLIILLFQPDGLVGLGKRIKNKFGGGGSP